MNNIKKLSFAAFVALNLTALTGCQSVSDIPNSIANITGLGEINLSPEAAQLNNQVTEFDKTVAQGVLAGAATGALIGLAAGDSKEAVLVGAVVGAAAGAGYGYYIAGKKQEYADEESTLNAIKQDLQESNDSLVAMVGTSERILLTNQSKLAELKTQLANNQIPQKKYDDMLAQVRSDQKIIEKAIKVVDQKYAQATENMKSFEGKYGAEGKKELQAMLLDYQKQKTLLAAVDTKLADLGKEDETES